jgi:uncharacterized protein YndB with AHSA1/START domain
MSNEIRLQQRYEFAPERVWRALTDSDALAQWLMPNDFKPVVGHRFQFRLAPMPGWRGYVECEVTELEPPRRLAYTWRGDESWTCDTTVGWTLEPADGGTLLTLEHTGFEEPWGPSVVEMLSGGWKGMLAEKLRDAVASLENVPSS